VFSHRFVTKACNNPVANRFFTYSEKLNQPNINLAILLSSVSVSGSRRDEHLLMEKAWTIP
jgi:hypothetical protein